MFVPVISAVEDKNIYERKWSKLSHILSKVLYKKLTGMMN